jgi:hypothetical protein
MEPLGPQPRRTAWHLIGLVVAAAVAWLILQGYRQPELLLELANMRLC